MKISELITELENIKEKHGDIEVEYTTTMMATSFQAPNLSMRCTSRPTESQRKR